MSAREIVKDILHKEKLKIAELAEMLNTSQPNLSKKLNTDTIRYREMEEIAELLKYSIKWDKAEESHNMQKIEKELLILFSKLPESEKYRMIGRIEEVASKYEDNSKQQGLSSTSKTG